MRKSRFSERQKSDLLLRSPETELTTHNTGRMNGLALRLIVAADTVGRPTWIQSG